jgi:SAM-dependent methyltransferase
VYGAGLNQIVRTRSVVEAEVEGYYTRKFMEFGATAQGVDWNGRESQTLRFRELLKIHSDDRAFSLLDYGCGYGALAAHVLELGLPFASYTGFDLSVPMLDECRCLYGNDRRFRFCSSESQLGAADYSVASGVFNVRLGFSDDVWSAYVDETLDRLWELSGCGMAFNVLTRYSDLGRMRQNLYYADPLALFDRCKRRYSRHVALSHDYGLYEFTLLVRREPRAA